MGLFNYKCERLIEGNLVSFPCCAKVNLFLDIMGRREDGYHYIRSLFVPVSLFDVLIVRLVKGEGLRIKCSEEWFDPKNNTLVKAYKVFGNYTGFFPPISIDLIKNIPVGSGLGGASSDAAMLMKILNRLMYLEKGKALVRNEMEKLSVDVGGDVPFFIRAKPSIVEGIGEIISEVKIKRDLFLVIVCPDVPFYTKEMYDEYDRLNRLTKPVKGDRHLPPFLGYKYIADSVFNVFEKVIRGRNLRMVMRIKRLLRDNGADAAALSGSGSSVFGLFKSAYDACFVSMKVSKILRDYKVFSVKVIKGEF